jgi:hypothetical protein
MRLKTDLDNGDETAIPAGDGFYDGEGTLLIPIEEMKAEQLRDFYQVCLHPDFENWGINSDNGGVLDKCFKRAVELLFLL